MGLSDFMVPSLAWAQPSSWNPQGLCGWQNVLVEELGVGLGLPMAASC